MVKTLARNDDQFITKVRFSDISNFTTHSFRASKHFGWYNEKEGGRLDGMG